MLGFLRSNYSLQAFVISFQIGCIWKFTVLTPDSFIRDSLIIDRFSIYIIILLNLLIISRGACHGSPTSDFVFMVGVLIIRCFMVIARSRILGLYIFYEISIFPIRFIILKWGRYPERAGRVLMLIIYTLIFSLPFIYTILGNYYLNGGNFLPAVTISHGDLLTRFLILFVFGVKLPILGIHRWLPMAHVEAPTFGSMVLAGILLKLGGMGLIRLNSLLAKPELLSVIGGYLVFSFAIRGIMCLFQTDFKKVIAYSSIFHIRVIPILTILPNSIGVKGILVMMLLHGLISPILFMLVGVGRKLLKTRMIILIQGMGILAPWLLTPIVFGFLLNLPCPPFLSFLGEILFFVPAVVEVPYLVSVIFIGIIVSLLYNLNWAMARISPSSPGITSLQVIPVREQIRRLFFVSTNLLVIPFFGII